MVIKGIPKTGVPKGGISELRETEKKEEEENKARAECVAKGGTWDAEKKVCIPAPPPVTTEPAPTGLSREQALEIERIRTLTSEERGGLGLLPGERAGGGFDPRAPARTGATFEQFEAGKRAREEQAQQLETQQLVEQVGQVQPSTGITPTGVDVGEAVTTGVVGSIPGAIRQAGTFAAGAAVAGGIAGSVVPGVGTAIGIGAGAAIGAAVGLVSGIAGGMISNMKGQRTDDTNAQQRVLDEGKQTLKDWSTMAKADPTNREYYLSQFNIQLQLIQDAHVQMLTDTNADVAKFESAVPNLAEFNSFYSVGGERDALVNDMIVSLQTPVSVDYSMIELTNRRFIKDETKQ